MLSAGYGQEDITPEIGELNGDSSKITSYVKGYEGRLTVRVIFMTDGGAACALAMAEVGGFTIQEDRRLRRAMAGALGLPIKNVRLNVSHTHTAPHTYLRVHEILAPYGIPFVSPAWMDRMEAALTAAAEAAKKSAVPVTVQGALSRVERVAASRLVYAPDGNIRVRFGYTTDMSLREAPEGFYDPDVAVLQLRRADGRPLATIFNYACHMTSLGLRGEAVSPDIAGFAAEEIEKQTGGPAFFLQGACGNVSPGKYADGSLATSKQMAARLSGAVLDACGRLEARGTDMPALHNWEEPVELSPDLPAAAELEARIRQEVEAGVRNSNLWKYAAMLEVVRWAQDVRRCQLFLWQARDWCLAGLPAESMSEAAVAIKNASPFPLTLVGAYYDCTLWYIPTWKSMREGGFESRGGWNYTAAGASEQLTRSVIRRFEA